jgi:hypothetical protein
MTSFTSEQRSEGYEDTRWQNVYLSPSLNPNQKEDWYQIIDTRKSWRNNDTWIRVIKRNAQRINFAKKSQMTPFDREVEKYINQTYPLPQ